MPSFKDLTGQTYGRLRVIRTSSERSSGGSVQWECACACGASKIVRSGDLVSGHIRSCGCFRRETVSRTKKTHGMTGTKIHMVWQAMIRRCYNRNCKDFVNYGARGITVCERWRKFENFYADMGEPPPGMTLDRRLNNRGYYRQNCRWAPRTVQYRNRRMPRNWQTIYYEGKRRPVFEVARELGLNLSTVQTRLSRGWSPEKALCLY